MRLRTIGLALIAGCLSLGTMACTTPTANLPHREMPAGATFSGLWYTNFGDMTLTQKMDGYTRGTFDYKGEGQVEGKVEGGVFIFDWMQPGDFQIGRREVRGKGYLVISDDGLSMTGQWGYGDAYTGGGEWTGNKATEIYR
ncbi:MAG: hypothetical protein J6A01_02525 [Proteobacteria bacterium]|nr:hypothetical protein [Pseudomonadota bacterium]